MSTRFNAEYRSWLRHKAMKYGFDGCTLVSELYQDACYEHDYHYKFAKMRDGSPVTRSDADRLLREAIQELSPLGIMSPAAWWRWAGCRIGAWKAWSKHRG